MNKVQKILDMIDVGFFTALTVLFYFNVYLVEWSSMEKSNIDFARNLVLVAIVIWWYDNKKENQPSSLLYLLTNNLATKFVLFIVSRVRKHK